MSTSSTFFGCYTALVTPFTETGVDFGALERLLEWQIAQGVHGVVPCGTTGESPTLSPSEHAAVVEHTIRVVRGRVKVMAGTGSNATAEAMEYTAHAAKAGADAALVVAPYYNKPTQEGLYQHFKAVAAASDIPVIVYNIPGRSVVNLTDETLARLAEIPNIAGVKDATGDLARVATLRHRIGDRLALFSGEDMTTVGFNAMGGCGVISVASNLVPHPVAQVQNLTREGKFSEATQLQQTLVPLIQALFMETNPIPVKYGASLMGMGADCMRLPLVPPSSPTQQAMRTALQALGVVS